MLSAVAARKARLAQSQAQTQTAAPEAKAIAGPSPPYPVPQAKATPVATKPPAASQKPPSKRKPSTSAGNPFIKKKKSQHRKRPQEQQPARYFAQADAFKAQDDLIVVDESDSESSVASSSAESDKDWTHARPTQSKTAGKRAWSPSAPLADSSDEEDEQVPLDVSAPAEVDSSPDAPTVLSTFQPVLDQNVFHLPPSQSSSSSRQGRAVLLLRASESVALLGAYTLTVLRGVVSLGGVILTASSTAHPVFAPRSSPIPIIQCLTRRSSQQSVPSFILPANVAEAASNSDAAIMLQELHTGIEGLGRICRTFDGFFAPSRWWRNQERFDLGLGHVYFLPHQTPDVSPLVVPPTWTKATNAVLPPSAGDDATAQRRVCLIKGPKNAGKSTFAKYLMNTLLTRHRRVAYLECDLGQSEFTPGGMVSLNVIEKPVFGPSFSHPSIPFAAHYIGATSPRSSPSHYLDSIQALIQQYEIDVQDAVLDEEPPEEDGRISSTIPLVVNTMGWTKGLGADLARKVEEIIGPTDIFPFVATSPDDDQAHGTVPSQIPAHVHGPRVHPVESVPSHPSASHNTAADHRNLSILSYLHAIFPREPPSSPYASPIATTWNTATPLCAQAPYEVDGEVAFDKLILTGAGMEDVVSDEVQKALNCAIVGLVSCEPGTLEADAQPEDDGSSTPLAYEQGAPPPLPTASRCLGLALVRAIGPSPATPLQLLTPVPLPLLSSARVLVMGELQLPVWGMLDFRTLDDSGEIAGYERGKVPYLRWGKGEGAGGERRRVRRNLMRKGQM
ncbi:hypothetical protein C8Q73DRAFT_656603 [Cubamyces lactineus]|nr:hypothetical protein C8Q73DRAFT_656603 [Cubamyces lactineus]